MMPIYWMIVIAALIVFVQTRIYRKWGLSRVTYSRKFSTRACVEGEQVQMVETIANRKMLPVPWLRLESLIHVNLQFGSQQNFKISTGESYQNHRSLFSLMPYKQITRRHTVTALKRGCYTLNTATMTCSDLLGFVRTWRTEHLDIQLLVYPQIVPMEEIPLPSHSWQGDITVRRWIVEDPFLISGVREYRYGDPMNTINWKATARSGTLQVHKRDYTADHRLMIYVNFEMNETMWGAVTEPERIEKGIRYAATLAHRAIQQGIDTGFGCNGQLFGEPADDPVRVYPHGGSAQLTLLLETMAKLIIARSVPFADFLAQDAESGTSNTDFIIITPYVSERIRQQIARLESMGNAVTIVPLEPENASAGGAAAAAAAAAEWTERSAANG